MIIVGQLDDMIVNFDLVSDIFIRDRTHVVSSCPHIENYTLVLGRYETEERAKEVLQDLISEYQDIDTRVYYMPKE